MDLTKSQKLVIDTHDKNILVSASAGSGKTFVVVERILESIKKGKDISKLLVLTFTNAAASELKERIIKGLNELRDEYSKQDDFKNVKRISGQISKVNMADISTIHSFCLNVIRNNFYVIGIDPMVTTLDESKVGIMINESILEVLDEEYEKASESFKDILDLNKNEENLIFVINLLYNAYRKATYSNKWTEKCESIYSVSKASDLGSTPFGQVIISSIKERIELLKYETENLIDKLDSVSEFETRRQVLIEIRDILNLLINTSTYDKLYEMINSDIKFSNLPNTKVSDETLKEEVYKLKKNVTNELKKIKTIIYKDSNGIIKELNETKKYLDWYIDVVKRVDEKYTNEKKKKSVIDFLDYEHLALEALEDESVVNKYKEKYDEIYIDEYQDTSYIQEEIINKISKNNVIMVGDVKQSIYGFRNAKPDLFITKYETYEKIEDDKFKNTQGKIILSENFRSRKEVIDSINDIFEPLMNVSFGGSSYNEIEKLKCGADYPLEDSDIYKTEINLIESDNISVDDESIEEVEKVEKIVKESIFVADKIKEIMNSGLKIYDLKKKEYRNIKYKDIVILLRSVESKANILRDILLSKNIPAYTDGREGMYDSDEINLVISFLKVLNNPLDDISLVSIMYSVIGKFTLDELVEITISRSNNHIINILENNEFGEKLNNKVQEFLKLLERFKGYLKAYKLSDIIEKLYVETGIYNLMSIEEMGALKCANLDSFVKVVSDFEKNESISSIYLLLKYIKGIKAKGKGSDSIKIIGEDEDVVRIMSIHKSKGLEFPVVILMSADMKYNENDLKEKVLIDDNLGIGLDMYIKEMNLAYPTLIKQAIKEKKKRELRSESLRLLYVALTRAKEKLVICGSLKNFDEYMSKLFVPSNKISQMISFTYNNFLSLILSSYNINSGNIKINLIEEKDVVGSKYLEESKEAINRESEKLDILKRAVKKYNLKTDAKELSNIQNKLVKIDNVTSVNKKYTVTELKKKEDVLSISDLKPETISNKINSTSYGTYIHNIIENLKYNNINYDYILTVAKNSLDTLGISKDINITKVADSIFSMYINMKDILDNAKVIKNELEFVVQDDLIDIEGIDINGSSLIQGVIDMYVNTKDNKHVIIDFKTDRVENEYELIDRYSVQLKVYKKALEIAYGIKVDNMYIYSFSLGKLIEI